MTQVELVKYDSKIHFDYISTVIEGGIPIEKPYFINGVPYVFILEAENSTLTFKDINQLKIAQEFFSKKLRPSTKGNNPPYEHYWHVWFGRLPKKILKSSNRETILKAINNALDKYEKKSG